MDITGLCYLFLFVTNSVASYHEQYRVPNTCTDKWESYIYNDKEYIVQNLPVNWENAKILCRGHHNGTLAVLDDKEKSEFMAEALSESQFSIESVWIGARRSSADDPTGYRWSHGVELRRTAMDVLAVSEKEGDGTKHYPMWLNRTRVPVPEGGADCVALERVFHDHPVFVDLQCLLERPFVCEREAQRDVNVNELKVVRCRTGLYHIYDGRKDWHQAAAYCVLRKMRQGISNSNAVDCITILYHIYDGRKDWHQAAAFRVLKKMSLANIGTMRCLKKLGMTMLKTRPSIENAWIGARGSLGKWSWVDSGVSIFHQPPYSDVQADSWPPMRDRNSVKQSGCLQLDRHAAHPPVFMEARCERKMQFICYQGMQALVSSTMTPSDDTFYYVLVRQLLYWQHAFDNCQKMNGTLASVDSAEVLIQLLLTMGENKEEPIGHIWISGRLNMSKDATDTVAYFWHNPANGKRIYDPMHYTDPAFALYMPPWLDEEFSMDNSCLNLDRQDHLKGLVYGLPCDTPQYSICMIEKSIRPIGLENITEGYETT